MKSHLMVACLLSLGVLLAGCDNAPPSTAQNKAEAETPEKKMADLMKRAEKGDPQAQFELGHAYFHGQGVPQDSAKAAEWFEKASAQGHKSAQVTLAAMYATGNGVPKNLEKTRELATLSATGGHARGQYMLGEMYLHGEGVPKDVAKAVEWYQKAASQGDVDAQFKLGTMYYIGMSGPRDTTKAIEWYEKAAAQGHARAQINLGQMYRFGDGVPKDAAKAVEWWQKAAAQGDSDAQSYLGVIYSKGEGIPKDAAKAVEWYQKAAAQGHAGAQFNLGFMYFSGEGVPSDKVVAYAWYNLSASSGEEFAGENRRIIERRMTPAEIAEAQRLSSAWKKGQILVREGRSASASAAPSATPGKLSKSGTGTLFLVNATGQAITNHHVVAGCGELRIEGRDGLAKVVTEDAVNDLALVQIPGEVKASAAMTAESGKLRQGEDIVVFGFPLNAVLSSGGNLTPVVVSALTGLGNNTNQIQITAPIQPGSSGSPVLNKKGEVVGVVSMKLSDSKMAKATGQVGQNVNFAVNGQTLRTFLDTHKVAYRSGGGFFSRDKSTADLADEARKWTLVVECWK